MPRPKNGNAEEPGEIPSPSVYDNRRQTDSTRAGIGASTQMETGTGD
jgi:hypothetical protein